MIETKFNYGKWKIHQLKLDGEFINGPSKEKDRSCEVICANIFNPYDAQLIESAPNMYGLLKYIYKLLDTPDKIDSILLKKSIENLLDYINRERN